MWVMPRVMCRCLVGMGTLKPVELHRGLSDYALQSALHDLRFSPISLKEVKMLTCRVSILHSFESCSDPLDWKLGTHGVTIAFTVPRRPKSGASNRREESRLALGEDA
ncbi:Uncharacterized protein CG5902 [Durusdinium trenchii]|uniref:Uncharacterized protein CG5902 n=1 Tax=Durusdinium trenchii TaxID=1381693 RepID=A0ABP0JE48_9DINO